jgi:hypothetical protein
MEIYVDKRNNLIGQLPEEGPGDVVYKDDLLYTQAQMFAFAENAIRYRKRKAVAQIRTYKGINIHPAKAGADGLRWWASVKGTHVRAQTIDGIQRAINVALGLGKPHGT